MNTRRPAAFITAAVALLLAAGGPLPAQAAAVGKLDAVEGVRTGREILVMLRLPPDHLRPGASYGREYGDRLTSVARRRAAKAIARRHGLELVGDGWPMPLLGIDCYVMRAPEGRSIEAVIAEISRDSQVAWSTPMAAYGPPDDDVDQPSALPPEAAQ